MHRGYYGDRHVSGDGEAISEALYRIRGDKRLLIEVSLMAPGPTVEWVLVKELSGVIYSYPWK